MFEYLISEKFNFRALNGHINSISFKNKYLERLDSGSTKMVIPTDILIDILYGTDEFLLNYKFDKNNEKYYHLLIARLYIKLSLLIPLKPGILLSLKLGDIRNKSFSEVVYNGISIKIPKSVKGNIIEIVEYAEEHYEITYDASLAIFEISNGVNIVYLKQLTGLDINTLLADYDLEELKANMDMKSYNINSGLTYSSYYTFL